ncbi:hypothetical protein [Pseudoflavonifractor phocaeensis]|uniref:hypothetical protein n=1 Tax=Pseudoflavonifractor phocaeensis TaxID=1870988 RepID=UPI00195D9699|nr:hypothetical protein [Pseudoflavonifractor phocaeensis]MBM6724587.1 hypothetical protein [Pseudoflavonifractor phocaeensis]
MTDFMEFLYQHYIRPYVEAQPKDDGDTFRASLCENNQTAETRKDVESVVAFAATHAFFAGSAHRIGTGTGWPVRQRAFGGPLSTGGKG